MSVVIALVVLALTVAAFLASIDVFVELVLGHWARCASAFAVLAFCSVAVYLLVPYLPITF